MSNADAVINRIESEFKELADDVNVTSASARNGWLFFLAIQAYFFVALAGLTHEELLLSTPIQLPLLQVPVELKAFFLFGPFIFVLVHMGVLLQHVMLARQARELHARISNFEGRNLYRNHRVRIHLNAYSFTQMIAGAQRSPFFALFLAVINGVSLGILPIILLLDFQVTFLPYHDLTVTWAQRVFLIADIVLLLIFTVFMRHPALSFVAGFGRTLVERPLGFFISFVLAVGALFFSLSVATIPDERMDRFMTAFWPVPIANATENAGQQRQSFALTAWLFDGGVDRISGRPTSPFGRNLVVTDSDMVKDGAFEDGESSINLRMRDLRYGVFDRSDLHQADMTGAILTGASLRNTKLVEIKAEQAVFRNADLTLARFVPFQTPGRVINAVNLNRADFRGANLSLTNLLGASLDGALLQGAIFRDTQMDGRLKAEAERQGAKF